MSTFFSKEAGAEHMSEDAATTCIVAGAKQVSAKELQQSHTLSKKNFSGPEKFFFPALFDAEWTSKDLPRLNEFS